MIAGLILAKELEIMHLECGMDSLLVVGHMKWTFQVKDNQLLRYFHKVNSLLKDFSNFNIDHIPREQNSRANLLSKLTHAREKAEQYLVIKMTLDKPMIEAFATNTVTPKDNWRQNVR